MIQNLENVESDEDNEVILNYFHHVTIYMMFHLIYKYDYTNRKILVPYSVYIKTL